MGAVVVVGVVGGVVGVVVLLVVVVVAVVVVTAVVVTVVPLVAVVVTVLPELVCEVGVVELVGAWPVFGAPALVLDTTGAALMGDWEPVADPAEGPAAAPVLAEPLSCPELLSCAAGDGGWAGLLLGEVAAMAATVANTVAVARPAATSTTGAGSLASKAPRHPALPVLVSFSSCDIDVTHLPRLRLGTVPLLTGLTFQRMRQDDAVATSKNNVRMTVWIHGFVQGVGFRWWTRARALELGLSGYAANLRDGRVEVVAEGSRDACGQLLELLRSDTTPGTVDTIVDRWSDAKGDLSGFIER